MGVLTLHFYRQGSEASTSWFCIPWITDWFNRIAQPHEYQVGYRGNEHIHCNCSAPGDPPYNRRILWQKQGEISFLWSSILLTHPEDNSFFVCLLACSSRLYSIVEQKAESSNTWSTPSSCSQLITLSWDSAANASLSPFTFIYSQTFWIHCQSFSSDLHSGFISFRIQEDTFLKHNFSY